MNIRLQFSLTADDYVEFQREIHRLAKKAVTGKEPVKPAFSKFTWGLVLTLALILYLGLAFSPGRDQSRTNAFSVRSIATLLVIGGLISLYVMRHRIWEGMIRRAVRKDPRRAAAHDVTLCDENVTVRTETMTTTLVWTHFTEFAETRELFLLVVSSDSAQILPKRAFASAREVEEFRGFALAHVGNKPIGFPVQGL